MHCVVEVVVCRAAQLHVVSESSRLISDEGSDETEYEGIYVLLFMEPATGRS